MSNIEKIIKEEKEKRGVAFIPYLMSHYPSAEKFLKYGKILSKYAGVMEIGIPYSDPVADGPTIQEAHSAVLNLRKNIRELITIASEIESEKVIMTYFNPIHKFGIDKYFSLLADTGISGTLIPDLPVELANDVLIEANERDIDVVFLVSPNTSKERMKTIANESKGFIYVVQRYGVTGETEEVYSPIGNVISYLKKLTEKPVGVGFGISKFEHIAKLANMGADAVIVGSHIIRVMKDTDDETRFEESVRELIRAPI